MIAKELEGKVQQLSQQFHDKVTTIDEKLTPTPPAPSLLGLISSTLPNNVKRLSSAEQTERRSEGLCFKYDEQFKPGHRCKQSQLLLLDVDITLHNPPKPLDHHSDWKIPIIETG
ncbi:hypothetical protein WN944_010749 [Citrus x changshan-huyou]|uniref:Uncharacterized protein n=1 Tax=Citrus x changshan-huyou TaxID=2935761 RepID=A0AAP0R0X5_9ROSI